METALVPEFPSRSFARCSASLAARTALAMELACVEDEMADTV